MALPPSSAGAVHVTTADVLSACAATAVGGPGVLAPVGVTAFDFADSALVPPAFDARTVNVYAVPASRPVTVADVSGGAPVIVLARAVCAVAPAYGVIVYEAGAPPDDGAVHDTVADERPAVAVAPLGVPGASGSANRTSTQ